MNTVGRFTTHIDQESRRPLRPERGEFGRMFDDAARRKFDMVLFWSLDRFTREGIQKTIFYLQQLYQLGVSFKSLTEPLLDTDNELVAHYSHCRAVLPGLTRSGENFRKD